MRAMTRLLTLLTALLLLGGCSGMRLVESQVQAVATQGQTIATGSLYRFERLPSQASNQPSVEQVEAIAEAELSEVGLVHDETSARYSVQISNRMQAYAVDPWGRPQDSGRFQGSIMIGSGGMGSVIGLGLGMGMGMGFPPPPASQYHHEARLVLRDLTNGLVVYETSATHEGPWSDSDNILRALLAAALKDFPNPPPGPRRVKVEIPR
jgi:Domain of unknown function (DUF4136)